MRRTILLVEDDLDLGDALRDGLAPLGYRVTMAADGEEAFGVLQRMMPDAIVLDLMMPGMNGWAFRVAQRENRRFANIPVIAMSASQSPMAAAIDADLFLQKPVDAYALHTAIESVLAIRESG
jgi:CheY-like chemotaxis protein